MSRLSGTKVRTAKATGKAYKLSDGGQLYLYVSAKGSRSWRMNYQFGRNAAGKSAQKTLTIGSYPAISLREARDAGDVVKGLLEKGLEPKPEDLFSRSKVVDTRPTFETVGHEWHKLNRARWSEQHASDVLDNLEKEVFLAIGSTPIEEIDAPAVLHVLQTIVDRGAIETAHRTRGILPTGHHPPDTRQYHQRNVIESLFGRVKNWCRIATCYDHHAQNYLAAIALVDVASERSG